MQQCGEAENIGADHPLDIGKGSTQVARNRREDDGDVREQAGHARAEAVSRIAGEAPGLKPLPPRETSQVARGLPPKHRPDAACHHLCERAWG